MKKISILVPCYNEEASLPLLYAELQELFETLPAYEWEVWFVNDGSTDHTQQVLLQLRSQDERVNVIDLSRNFGKENAMLAGFDYVQGDCMVIMDADLQDPPRTVVEMVQYWEEGYQDVYARRKTRGNESWLRKTLSLAFYQLLQRTSRFDILQNVGDFRLLDRACIDALRQLRETERYTKGIFCWIGYKKKEVLFEREDRLQGTSSWNYMKLTHLAIEGITSFTTTPLRLASILGIAVSITAFLYMLYIMFKTIFVGEPIQGFPTLIIVILFLGGVQLLSLGIIGEYVGRIFHETRRRPPYLVNTLNGQQVAGNTSQGMPLPKM